jgi:fructokinase
MRTLDCGLGNVECGLKNLTRTASRLNENRTYLMASLRSEIFNQGFSDLHSAMGNHLPARNPKLPVVLCLGELLVDLVPEPSGAALGRSQCLKLAPGGAPANVAVALQRLGVRSGFIGKVGDDPFGRFLRGVLAKEGLLLDCLGLVPGSQTRLACVTNDANEQQRFIFYGSPGADVLLHPRDIQSRYVKQARFLHFGSISLIHDPARSATLKALALAKKHGLLISFDPNLRPALWPDLKRARTEILGALPWCDILKMNESEWEFLFPGRSFEACFTISGLRSLRLVAVTLGKSGSLLASSGTTIRAKGIHVRVADTTGAGDGFMAGILCLLARAGLEKVLDVDFLRQMGCFANTVAALSCTKAGAIPAFPSLKEVSSAVRGSCSALLLPRLRDGSLKR